MSNLTAFHLFPQLPYEIRHSIWLLTMPSRLVEMHLVGERFLALRTPKRLGVAAINHESREQGGRHIAISHCLIHPIRDILYVPPHGKHRVWLFEDTHFDGQSSAYPLGKLECMAIGIHCSNSKSQIATHLKWMINYGYPRSIVICPIPQAAQGSGPTHITVEVPRGERGTFSFSACSADLDPAFMERIKPGLIQALQKELAQEDPQTRALPRHGIVFVEWPTDVLEDCVQNIKLGLTQALINGEKKRPGLRLPKVCNDVYFAIRFELSFHRAPPFSGSLYQLVPVTNIEQATFDDWRCCKAVCVGRCRPALTAQLQPMPHTTVPPRGAVCPRFNSASGSYCN